jgi:hypothetical protein
VAGDRAQHAVAAVELGGDVGRRQAGQLVAVRVRVVAELVAGLGQGAQPRGVGPAGGVVGGGELAVGVAADHEPGDADAAGGEQPGGAGQRALQDDVLQLAGRRAQAVDPVVAGDAVEIDRDRAGARVAFPRRHGLPPNRMT